MSELYIVLGLDKRVDPNRPTIFGFYPTQALAESRVASLSDLDIEALAYTKFEYGENGTDALWAWYPMPPTV